MSCLRGSRAWMGIAGVGWLVEWVCGAVIDGPLFQKVYKCEDDIEIFHPSVGILL